MIEGKQPFVKEKGNIMKANQKLGIYIHLPFCKKKCDYCDFYSLPSGKDTESLMEQYQEALLAHMAHIAPTASGYTVDTIYFGGGTPSYYGAVRIQALLRAVKKAFRVQRTAEITVEGNPDSMDKGCLQMLKKSGVNRISMGLQSTQEGELQSIGRIHSPQDAFSAVALCKTLQMENLSLDLMYGLPEQSMETWIATLEEAIALEPQHLSCYGLKVEEGTALYKDVEQGKMLPSEDSQAELYLYTVKRLEEAGYFQYEISNFAQKTRESQHNLGYWLGKPYLGFGASAASDFGGYRFTMVASVSEYCHCVQQGSQKGSEDCSNGICQEIYSSYELMGTEDRQAEYLLLRLRTVTGISPRDYEAYCNLDFAPLEERLCSYAQEGWAIYDKGRWCFTAEGFLRCNLLLVELLELQERSDKPKPPPIRRGTSLKQASSYPESPDAIYDEDDSGQFYFRGARKSST